MNKIKKIIEICWRIILILFFTSLISCSTTKWLESDQYEVDPYFIMCENCDEID